MRILSLTKKDVARSNIYRNRERERESKKEERGRESEREKLIIIGIRKKDE
jgi:hypothetical protein